MKAKLKSNIRLGAIVVFLILTVATFAGCGYKLYDPRDDHPVGIMYDFMGARDKYDRFNITLYFKENEKIRTLQEAFASNPSELPSLKDHKFDGYYKTVTGIDDHIEYSDKVATTTGNGVLTFVNFTVDNSDGVTILYLKWQHLFWYQLAYVGDSGTLINIGLKTAVEIGDKYKKPVTDPTRVGYTFTGYYQDKECTIPWDTDFTHPGQIGDEYTVYVYAGWTKN